MKKLLLVILATVLSISMSAQTTLTEAVDFTATDCHGTEVNLFEILDGGQYVLIDFFFTSCGPCQAATPMIAEAYRALGCNNNEVYFMEISPSDGNAALQNWTNNYGVEYPTIGRDSGGNDICNTYGITLYPTVILIAPNRDIVIRDLYPITNAQTIISQLGTFGIEEHECGGTTSDPTVEITIGNVGATSIEVSFEPNETCASYAVLAGIDSEMQSWASSMGTSIEILVKQWGITYEEAATYTWTEMAPETEYTIYALPMNADGTAFELKTKTTTTQALGGTGVSAIDLSVEVLSNTEVKTTATPNAETAVFHVILITKASFDEIGEEAAINIVHNDPYPLYDVDIWTWRNLEPNTDYYAIANGKNANGEWGEVNIVAFITDTESVSENEKATFLAYPNPANEMIQIKGENIESIEVFNSLGQKMQVALTGESDPVISTQSFENGIYFAHINGKSVVRFVVLH